MTYGSLFAGIGGFCLGMEQAGMRCAWRVEVEPNCCRVLSRHWPSDHLHKDVRDFHATDGLVRPGVVTFGFPCQDVSVAGRRAGLDGERSGLFWEAPVRLGPIPGSRERRGGPGGGVDRASDCCLGRTLPGLGTMTRPKHDVQGASGPRRNSVRSAVGFGETASPDALRANRVTEGQGGPSAVVGRMRWLNRRNRTDGDFADRTRAHAEKNFSSHFGSCPGVFGVQSHESACFYGLFSGRSRGQCLARWVKKARFVSAYEIVSGHKTGFLAQGGVFCVRSGVRCRVGTAGVGNGFRLVGAGNAL